MSPNRELVTHVTSSFVSYGTTMLIVEAKQKEYKHVSRGTFHV